MHGTGYAISGRRGLFGRHFVDLVCHIFDRDEIA